MYLAPVPEGEGEDNEPLVLNGADQTVVADAVAPFALVVSRERLAVCTRIFRVQQSLLDPRLDHLLGVWIEFLDIFLCTLGVN